jgi:hypothetical protein
MLARIVYHKGQRACDKVTRIYFDLTAIVVPLKYRGQYVQWFL